MNAHWVRTILCSIITAGVTTTISAEELRAKTERAVIFKDGYSMLVKRVQGRIGDDGKAWLDGVPSAMILGSSWMIPDGPRPLTTIARQAIASRAGKNETEKRLDFEFDPKDAGKDAGMQWSYFGPGMRWVPTYRIALGDKPQAELQMQAEILNEMEDLDGVPVDLVVGVPNFRFKDVVSPLALEANLINPLQQVAPQLMGQSVSMSNIATQAGGEFRARRRPEDGSAADSNAPQLPSELAGEQSQDLFVYTLPKLSLRAGERAAVPVVSASLPIRHLYTWDVQMKRSSAEAPASAARRVSPMKLLKSDIWHQIVITNTTSKPLTTGAAMVVEGFLPIAQELLTYTPPGGRSELPLTIAVDVRGEWSEQETAREPEAARFDGYAYAKISKHAVLKATNYKKEAVDLRIRAEFGGNGVGASDDGKITIGDYQEADWTGFHGHPALDGHSRVDWEMSLKPGESREVTCDYAYFVRVGG